jgi:hypothetical protein
LREARKRIDVFCRPGDDLLSQVLRHSTIGAEAFDGRVRDGIGSDRFAEGHQAGETHLEAYGLFYLVFCTYPYPKTAGRFSGIWR